MLPKIKDWIKNPRRAHGNMDAAWDAPMIMDRPEEAYAAQIRAIRTARVGRIQGAVTFVGIVGAYTAIKTFGGQSLMPDLSLQDMETFISGDGVAVLAAAGAFLGLWGSNRSVKANSETANVIRTLHPDRANEFDILEDAYETEPAPLACLDREGIDMRVQSIKGLQDRLAR
jgi:hypothetical protein